MKPVLLYLEEAVQSLTKGKIDTPRLDAEVLLAHALGCERHELYTAATEYLLLYGKLEIFKNYLSRRLRNEPVAYIVGYKEFWSLRLKVTPAVLIPRPETESLVEKALAILDQRGKREEGGWDILDLCTGSGAIAAALAKELPNARITAADISEEALAVAGENLQFAADRVRLVQSSLFEKMAGTFDLIVSNPPYIPTHIVANLDPDITDYEPHRALDGGRDGLDFVAKIRQDAPNFLKPDGWLVLENGANGKVDIQIWNTSSLREASPSTASSI